MAYYHSILWRNVCVISTFTLKVLTCPKSLIFPKMNLVISWIHKVWIILSQKLVLYLCFWVIFFHLCFIHVCVNHGLKYIGKISVHAIVPESYNDKSVSFNCFIYGEIKSNCNFDFFKKIWMTFFFNLWFFFWKNCALYFAGKKSVLSVCVCLVF